MAGYVGMVQSIISNALLVFTMLESTVYYIISGMPDIAAAWNLGFDFFKGAADWVGYLVAAIYYFGIDFGYAEYLCTASCYELYFMVL